MNAPSTTCSGHGGSSMANRSAGRPNRSEHLRIDKALLAGVSLIMTMAGCRSPGATPSGNGAAGMGGLADRQGRGGGAGAALEGAGATAAGATGGGSGGPSGAAGVGGAGAGGARAGG